MSSRLFTIGTLVAASLTTIATFYHFSYLFFLLRDRFGFDDRANLGVAALHGAIYIGAAWWGGRFAERRGHGVSLAVGFAGLSICLIAGAFVPSAAGLLVVVVAYTVALLHVWPALEAMTIAGEPPDRVPHAVGIYNLTWSGSAAFAYFTGGPLYDWLGPRLVFEIPAAIMLIALAGLAWLCRRPWLPVHAGSAMATVERPPAPLSSPPRARTFLQLAWLANPLAYVAIYTLLAVMPGLAAALGFSPTQVGLFCAIWFFARLVAFAVLWQWPGWHYRFGWLAASYVLLVVSFLGIVLAPNVLVLVVGQIVFGAATGMAYYSSLFYAMDLGEAKAEHGGLHEAGIGLGVFAGPAVGALSLYLYPAVPQAGALAVAALLAAGFVAMVVIWRRG
ncbi:MAG: hypothetical protein ABS36_12190 [Acidobacteria bacterium SCN 69-37]|nr:MAG: hypothetical protein ABS36_12190 [Acidobacteria bacterium SCN 69-37]